MSAEFPIARAVRDDLTNESDPPDESTAAIVSSLIGGIITLEAEVHDLKDRPRRVERSHAAVALSGSVPPATALELAEDLAEQTNATADEPTT